MIDEVDTLITDRRHEVYEGHEGHEGHEGQIPINNHGSISIQGQMCPCGRKKWREMLGEIWGFKYPKRMVANCVMQNSVVLGRNECFPTSFDTKRRCVGEE